MMIRMGVPEQHVEFNILFCCRITANIYKSLSCYFLFIRQEREFASYDCSLRSKGHGVFVGARSLLSWVNGKEIVI